MPQWQCCCEVASKIGRMQGEPIGNGSLVTAHEPATNGIRSNYGTIGDQPETPGN